MFNTTRKRICSALLSGTSHFWKKGQRTNGIVQNSDTSLSRKRWTWLKEAKKCIVVKVDFEEQGELLNIYQIMRLFDADNTQTDKKSSFELVVSKGKTAGIPLLSNQISSTQHDTHLKQMLCR